jgi:hypothetical protein
MKMKQTLLALSALAFLGVQTSNAASFLVTNVGDLTTDTIYASSSGVPLSTGIATIGYFPSGIIISTLSDLTNNIGSFSIQSSGIIGSTASVLGLNISGFAAVENPTNIGIVTIGNTLLGRPIYSIIGDGLSLEASTAFAVVQVGEILDDVPFENSYTSNPAGKTPIIGSSGLFNGELIPDLPGTYTTLNLIPEPSAALLGALGALGLLRRRRI